MRKAGKTGSLLGAMAAGFVADALWRRSRATGLATLVPSATEAPESGYHLISASGVVVADDDLRAARAYADERGLDVLDLVPGGLDSARALELLMLANPRTYRVNRLALGVTAGHALLVSDAVRRRAGITKTAGLTYDEMYELALRLKKFASVTSDLVVVSGLEPVPCSAAERRAVLRRRWR